MASVFKKARDRQRKGSAWYINYTDEHGVRRQVKGCSDKTATEAMARKLESEAELRRRGVIDPKQEAFRENAARALVEHLADFERYLTSKGGGAKHVRLTVSWIRRVVAMLRNRSVLRPDERPGSSRPGDAEGGRPVRPRTCNAYRTAVRSFTRWAWKTGRLHSDPLIGVTGFNAKEDRRHDRRTLALDELRRAASTSRIVARPIGA